MLFLPAMKSYVQEIESVLTAFPKKVSPWHPEAYIGGGQSKLRYIGLRVPQLRQAMRDGFSFSRRPPGEIAEIWDEVWRTSDCYEVMALALAWFYDPKQRPILLKHWPLLQTWSKRVDNWAHSDTLSGIYARIHEEAPGAIYPVFKKWNASENPWLRRLSIVSLFYYSSQREKQPKLDKVLALVKPQLAFDHYYVQKGVGWTLREAGNVYPGPVYEFLEKNILKISAHAYSAATEKIPKARREHLKRLRKTGAAAKGAD